MALATLLLGLEGNPKGILAGVLVLIWVGVLFGLPYMLLASNYGAKQAYLVMMSATFVVLTLLSSMWLLGAPGTVAGTGPRGREPAWVPFTPNSAQAADFPAVKTFPNGWAKPGGKFAGGVDSTGELKNLSGVWQPALAAKAASQGLTTGTDPKDYTYRTGEALTADDKLIPFGQVYFINNGRHLLAGITLPASDTHPEVTVFAYRDRGQVFYWAAVILVISIVGFAVHLFALARMEKHGKLPRTVEA